MSSFTCQKCGFVGFFRDCPRCRDNDERRAEIASYVQVIYGVTEGADPPGWREGARLAEQEAHPPVTVEPARCPDCNAELCKTCPPKDGGDGPMGWGCCHGCEQKVTHFAGIGEQPVLVRVHEIKGEENLHVGLMWPEDAHWVTVELDRETVAQLAGKLIEWRGGTTPAEFLALAAEAVSADVASERTRHEAEAAKWVELGTQQQARINVLQDELAKMMAEKLPSLSPDHRLCQAEIADLQDLADKRGIDVERLTERLAKVQQRRQLWRDRFEEADAALAKLRKDAANAAHLAHRVEKADGEIGELHAQIKKLRASEEFTRGTAEHATCVMCGETIVRRIRSWWGDPSAGWEHLSTYVLGVTPRHSAVPRKPE